MSRANKAVERTTYRDYLPQLWKTNADTVIKKRWKAEATSKMTVGKKKHVKCALAQRKPRVYIGKSGTSQELLREIEKQMKKE